MRTRLLTALCLSIALGAQAQLIDFNMTGRSLEEVNEPNYIAWAVQQGPSAQLTLDEGVTLTVAATGEADVLRAQWNKGTVTLGKNGTSGLRLLGDGVQAFKADEDNNTPEPKDFPTAITLTLEGLAPGKHSVTAYHNYRDPGATLPTIAVDVNGANALTGGVYTSNAQKTTEAGRSYVEFTAEEGQPVVIVYRTEPAAGTDYTSTSITLNGLEIDANPYIAQDPVPSNYEYHVDAPDGTCLLSWAPSGVAATHRLFFGTDSAAVANSEAYVYEGTAASYTATGLSPLVRYWWRVDEVETDGTVHHGRAWAFQPRRLAFPGAEGYGRFAIGGRGGVVYHVTTLLDNGDDDNPIEGSLRYGLKKVTGPRTIVFDVAGIIALKSRLTSADRYVTIAGQTAPGAGITLRTSAFGMQTDGITRFIRMRLGHKRLVSGTIPKEDANIYYGEDYGKYDETTLGGLDGMGMAGCDNAIMDHCSVSWTIDEAFSSRNAKAITLQRTLLSEALNQAGHPNYGSGTQHGYAATIGAGQMNGYTPGSFHHNLLAHCEGRNWSISGGLDAKGNYDGAHDVFNNVVYNWGGRATDGGTHMLNFVGNYYKKGAATTQNLLLRHQFEGTGTGTQQAYVSGNIRQEQSGTITRDAEGTTYRYELSGSQELTWEPWSKEPFFPSYATVETAEAAYKNVLSDVGCNMPLLDLHDRRMISETLAGTYTVTGSRSGKKGLIDSEEDNGCEGFDLARLGINEETRPANWDTDQDGIPDWFETIAGTDPTTPNNNDDRDGDGYTDLEEYLNWVAVPNCLIEGAGTEQTIQLAPYFAGYAKPLYDLTFPDGTDCMEDNDVLSFKAPAQGLYEVTVTASEGGISYTRTFHFAVSDGSSAGIADIRTTPSKNAPRYNLSGQRVLPAYRGIVISGGRKTIVKQ